MPWRMLTVPMSQICLCCDMHVAAMDFHMWPVGEHWSQF